MKISKAMPTIEETIERIKNAHDGQLDKAGKLYYLHPISVMNRLSDDTEIDVKLAALLHDIFEDTPVTAFDLFNQGYSEKTVNIVILLSFNEMYYNGNMSYISKIRQLIDSGNIDAIRVKYADMCDNTDETRLIALSQKEREYFIKKYEEPLKLLKEAIEEKNNESEN